MFKKLAVALGVTVFASAAMAQVDMTLDVRACGIAGGNSINVPADPGCEFTYAVVGELSNAPNQGLATVGFPLVYTGGDLARGNAPTELPMRNLAIPDGLNNPVNGVLDAIGFGGTPVRGHLLQCGGAQNTLGNEAGPGIDYLIGTPILNVAKSSSPEVLMTGSISVPAGAMAGEQYQLAISATCVNSADPASSSDTLCSTDGDCAGGEVCKGHAFAMVIKATQPPGINHLAVEAVNMINTTPLTLNVVAGAACPCSVVPPPQVLSWESMAMHGAVGQVGLLMPEDDTFTEPRSSGMNKIVVTFAGDVDASAAVATAEGCDANGVLVDLSGVTIGVAEGAGGNTVEITFSPALPGSGLTPGTHTPAIYRVALDGVAADSGARALTERTFKIVLGDAFGVPLGTGDGRVNAQDNGFVRSLAAQGINPIDPMNPQHVRADVFTNGAINAQDNGLVRSLAAEGVNGTGATLACIP